MLILYCIYIDDLVHLLRHVGVGCYLKNVFLSALVYADDMALLAPSLKGLQTLLKVCEAYCMDWDIRLNTSKSKGMMFGKREGLTFCILKLNGDDLLLVDNWVYLGVSLASHKFFNCNIDEKVKKFYKCANAIFRVEGRSNDMVLLRLIEAHCLPILTYAIEVIWVSNRNTRRKLRVAYNSIFRRIFGYRYRDSVTALQGFLGKPTWEQLLAERKNKFSRVALTANSLTATMPQ